MPSVFLFPVGGGSRGGGFEEGVTDDIEAGMMGTLPIAMSLPPTAVGSGVVGEPVAGMAGLEISETDWRRHGNGDSEERGVTRHGEVAALVVIFIYE